MEIIMKKTVIATAGTPGCSDFRGLIFTIDGNAESGDDLLDLARKAASMYAKTNEGKQAYKGNCNNFNWANLVDAVGTAEFSRICTELGGLSISYIASYSTDDLAVDLDEELMEDSFDAPNYDDYTYYWNEDKQELQIYDDYGRIVSTISDVKTSKDADRLFEEEIALMSEE